MKKILRRTDIYKFAVKIGDMHRGVFTKFPDVDMKEPGFYFIVDDRTGIIPFRFYVAPNQRSSGGANRTLGRIRNREHEPSAMVALLENVSLYHVSHDKIKNLFGYANYNNSGWESAIQLRYDGGENYTEYNRVLNDMYDFEFQLY